MEALLLPAGILGVEVKYEILQGFQLLVFSDRWIGSLYLYAGDRFPITTNKRNCIPRKDQ